MRVPRKLQPIVRRLIILDQLGEHDAVLRVQNAKSIDEAIGHIFPEKEEALAS